MVHSPLMIGEKVGGGVTQQMELIDCLRFYVPLKNFSLIWRRHHYRSRAAKFKPMLGAQGLSAGRDHYRATPAVTRGLGFFFRSYPKDCPIQSPLTTHKGMLRTYSSPDPHWSPFIRLIRHTRGCGGPILAWIFTGLHSIAS
jgi:hypothetical protein